MTHCRPNCGACCDPVTLPVTQLEVMRAPGVDYRIRDWILKDLTPISRREAKQKAPWLFGQLSEFSVENALPMFYRCRWFDPEKRICTAYEKRPPPCSAYPWAGKPPRLNAILPPMCSFRADIGKPVEPIPEEWQPVAIRGKVTISGQ
jgi:Fe-S-cluster containining protein